MPTVPDWIAQSPVLRALAEDPALRDLDLRFATQDQAREGGEALAQHYAGHWHLGVLWTPDLWTLCQEVAAGKLPAGAERALHPRARPRRRRAQQRGESTTAVRRKREVGPEQFRLPWASMVMALTVATSRIARRPGCVI
jgi:phage tail tape-measure protein